MLSQVQNRGVYNQVDSGLQDTRVAQTRFGQPKRQQVYPQGKRQMILGSGVRQSELLSRSNFSYTLNSRKQSVNSQERYNAVDQDRPQNMQRSNSIQTDSIVGRRQKTGANSRLVFRKPGVILRPTFEIQMSQVQASESNNTDYKTKHSYLQENSLEQSQFVSTFRSLSRQEGSLEREIDPLSNSQQLIDVNQNTLQKGHNMPLSRVLSLQNSLPRATTKPNIINQSSLSNEQRFQTNQHAQEMKLFSDQSSLELLQAAGANNLNIDSFSGRQSQFESKRSKNLHQQLSLRKILSRNLHKPDDPYLQASQSSLTFVKAQKIAQKVSNSSALSQSSQAKGGQILGQKKGSAMIARLPNLPVFQSAEWISVADPSAREVSQSKVDQFIRQQVFSRVGNQSQQIQTQVQGISGKTLSQKDKESPIYHRKRHYDSSASPEDNERQWSKESPNRKFKHYDIIDAGLKKRANHLDNKVIDKIETAQHEFEKELAKANTSTNQTNQTNSLNASMASIKHSNLKNNHQRHKLNEQGLMQEESIESMEDLHEKYELEKVNCKDCINLYNYKGSSHGVKVRSKVKGKAEFRNKIRQLVDQNQQKRAKSSLNEQNYNIDRKESFSIDSQENSLRYKPYDSNKGGLNSLTADQRRQFTLAIRQKVEASKQKLARQTFENKLDPQKLYNDFIPRIRSKQSKQEEKFNMLENEAQESIYRDQKHKFQQRNIIQKMLVESKSSTGSDVQKHENVMQHILLPSKLKEYNEQSANHKFSNSQKLKENQSFIAIKENIRKQITFKLKAVQSPLKRGQILDTEEFKTEEQIEQEKLEALYEQQRNELKELKKLGRIDKSFLDYLVNKNTRSNFLFEDIKEISRPIYREDTQDLKKEFVKRCIENNDSIPPPKFVVQNQFKSGLYALINLDVNRGQSNALGQSLKYHKETIQEIFFANNGFQDDQFADLLQQAIKEPRLFNDITRITYAGNNELSSKTFAMLERFVLEKNTLFPLTHLAIVNCKNRIRTLESLLLKIVSHKNQIKSLVIPKQHYGDKGFKAILSLISNSNFLQKIDLSWNKLLPGQIGQLFDILGEANRDLVDLNLAMSSVSPTLSLKPLKRFLRSNPKLQHLNLQGVLKDEAQVKYLIKAMAKQTSLLAVHLGNTPIIGQSKKLQAYIRRKLKIRGPLSGQAKEHANCGTKPSKFMENKLKNDWQLRDKLLNECNMNEQASEYFRHQRINQVILQEEILVLMRVIGFASMEFDEEWVCSSECYLCERWNLVAFMHLPKLVEVDGDQEFIQNSHESNLGLTGSYKSFQKLYNQNLAESDKSKGQEMQKQQIMNQPKMMSLNEFLSCYLGEYQTQSEFIDYQRSLFHERDLEKLESQPERYQNRLKRWQDEYEETTFEHVINFIQKNSLNLSVSPYPSIPVPVIQKYFSRDMQISLDIVAPSFKIEVFSVMTLPNPVQRPLISRCRIDEFQKRTCVKKVEGEVEQQTQRVFYKPHSVYAQWIEDTPKMLEDCAYEDFKYWKVPKFCKDPLDLDAVEQLILRNYTPIKQCFVNLICSNEFPNIGQLDFANWCAECGILDKKVTSATIDNAFVATNFEEEDLDDNPDRELCRYEFLEILVRLADKKYKETKKVATYAEALQKILHECIFNYAKQVEWQEFRDEKLWCLETNDVFELNMPHLKTIHSKLTKLKGKNGKQALQNVLNMITKDSKLEITYTDAFLCIGLSKMTIVNEVDGGLTKYNVLKLVEFIELIGRLAEIKFKSIDTPLATKIEDTLDLIFPAFGLQRIKDGQLAVYETDSSDESVTDDKLDFNMTLYEEEI